MSIIHSEPNIFDVLLKNPRIDLNSKKSNPLLIATARHITPAIESLLKKGADPEFQCENKESPMNLAQRLGYYDICSIFQRYKANKK